MYIYIYIYMYVYIQSLRQFLFTSLSVFGISEGSPSLSVPHVGTSHGALNLTRRPTKRSEEVLEKAPRDSRIDWGKFCCSLRSNFPYNAFLVARSEVESSSYRCTSKSQLVERSSFQNVRNLNFCCPQRFRKGS